MADDRISIVVQLRDRASRGLERLSGRMQQMAQVSVRGLATAFGAVTAAIGATVAGMQRLVKRGGDVINIQRAFDRVSGDLEGSLTTLRRATQGLVSDMDLMTQFNQAVALGVTDNAENFAELAETALALGRALGVDAKRALESLTLGIGRQSRMILDNLGITVSAQQAYEDYAMQLGVTVEELTEAERRQAFLNATLEAADDAVRQMGGLQENAADAANRFATQIRNVFDAFTALLAKQPAIESFFNSMAEGLDGIRILFEGGPEMEAARATLAGLEGADLGVLQNRAQSTADELENLRDQLSEVQQRIAGGGAQLGDITLFEELTPQVEALDFLLRELNNRIREFKDEASEPMDRSLLGAFLQPQPFVVGEGPSIRRGQQLEAFRQQQRSETVRRMFEASGLEMPTRIEETPIQPILDAMAEGEGEISRAGQVVVSSFGAMAEAAIRGTSQMEQVVINSFTNILQTLAQKQGSFFNLGGFGVPIIGAIGGILGGLFGGGRDRAVPVQVDRFGEEARRQQREDRGPDVVNVNLLDAEGNVIRTVQQIRRRSALDGVERLPRGA